MDNKKTNTNISNNQRYEVKMVFDALRLDVARSWIFSHTDSFRVAFPPRQINNIYFDTQDLELMSAHIQGVADRVKIRFRWYGKTWVAENGQLEIKKKNTNLGSKAIHKIDGHIDISQENWPEIFYHLKSSCSDKFHYLLDNTYPVLINLYQREYFTSFDGLVRVTLDYNMRAYEQSLSPKPNLYREQLLKNVVIIEMKANVRHYKRVANTLAQFPIYCSSFSKYLTGMETIIG